jgi:feruloyl-CoA synthase
MNKPPFAKISFAPPGVNVETRDDGTMIFRSPYTLAETPPHVPAMLHRWEKEDPERLWIAERTAPPVSDAPWRKVTYGEGGDLVRRLGQAFLDRGVTPERPVMLLSDNAVDNALVQLAAMEAGVPASPISQAYSLMSTDHGKLKYVHGLLTPGLVYAADGERFAKAFAALDLGDAAVVVSANAGPGQELLSDLMKTEPGPAVRDAYAAITPDTVAKVLFTSGSTGMPKGVITLQSMLTSNVTAMGQVWPFIHERPPVLVDWLPWSHTFGGSHNFNTVLLHGGQFWVDAGKPAPGIIEQTVANLKEVAPTISFNVPRGYDVLAPYLEKDEQLRNNFFSNLDMLFYAAAALPPALWAKLEALSIKARGDRVPMISSWGSTETAPAAATVHWLIEKAGVIGVPLPGTEIKLTPSGTKMELRVRGANVTPGYWRRPELNDEAFDEDGFFKMGDAGKLEDPDDPAKGLVFDGRTAENFKLMSGTWVHAGELRLKAIDAGWPVVADAVLTGHDREEIGLLIFPNAAGCASLVKEGGDDLPLPELIARPEVREALKEGLKTHNAENSANSRRFAYALIMAEPPSIDANEITDKGYVNQRAVLDNRPDQVAKIYAGGDPDVIEIV